MRHESPPVPPPKHKNDPLSGIPVPRLTSHKAHSHHFYFTNPGWRDGRRQLFFSSHRHNRTNLYSIKPADGNITRITDLARRLLLHACINPKKSEAYFDGPRALRRHHSGSHIQQLHSHPRFNAEGNEVVFTSDASGYCNVYLIGVPGFHELPPVEGE